MAKTWSLEGRSCKQQLHELYEKYGTLQSLNSYVKSPDPSITARIFAAQRGSDKTSYPQAVGDFKVTDVRDLTLGYDSRTSDGKPELPLNLGGEMITYYFGEAQMNFSQGICLSPMLQQYQQCSSSYSSIVPVYS